MSTRSSNAYFTSVAIHALIVGGLFFLAYATTDTKPIQATVMELVAGEGNNYGATAAPAIGVPGGSKVAVPEPPAPTPPTPVAPAPAPPQAAPLEQAPPQPNPITPAPPEAKPVAKPVPAKKPKAVPKPPDPSRNMVADLKRVEARREAKLAALYKKQQDAQAKRDHAAELAREAKNARLDPEGIKGGVVGGSTDNKDGGAGGKALTREEGDLLQAYIALLETRVKENHVQPDGLSDALTCKVSFFLGKDGSISSVRILRSSGNSEFDSSVVEAFNKTSGIGPRPDKKGETLQVEFSLKENNE